MCARSSARKEVRLGSAGYQEESLTVTTTGCGEKQWSPSPRWRDSLKVLRDSCMAVDGPVWALISSSTFMVPEGAGEKGGKGRRGPGRKGRREERKREGCHMTS